MGDSSTFKGLIGIVEDPKVPVAKACQAVEECLSTNRDNLQGFFEQCFAPLLARIFGYSGPSWLAQVAKSQRDADAKALLRLLSPSGPLFAAIFTADSDSSIRYHFPRQRLPTHTQMMLASGAGIQQLRTWPQYTNTMEDATAAPKGHVHVSVFQYFCYWFAFYAIKGGDMPAMELPSAGPGSISGFGSSVRRAADALHLTKGKDADPASRYPYIALLRQLLTEMVPQPGAATTAAQTAIASSTRAPTSPYLGSTSIKRTFDAAPPGLVFYSTLVEFWLKDADDPVALPPATATNDRDRGALGASPLTPLWATTYEPPSEELLEALSEVVRYVTVMPGRGGTGVHTAQAGSAWLPITSVLASAGGRYPPAGPVQLGASGQLGAQALSRQLFRMFYRAFTMWPDQRSIKPLLRIFLSFVAPWHTSAAAPLLKSGPSSAPTGVATPGTGVLPPQLTAHVSELAARVRVGTRGLDGDDVAQGGGSSRGYGAEWEQHVLSNIPFYLELFPLFLERSVSRVAVRGESAAQDVMRMMGLLETAPELVDLLLSVERDVNRASTTQGRRMEGPHAELLPWLLEQAQDWQEAATANALGDTPATAAASAAARGAQPTYAMFSVSERCASVAGRELLDLASGMLKQEQLQRMRHGLEKVLPLQQLADSAPQPAAQRTEALEHGQYLPRLPRSTWKEVRYKGDPMHRPITSFEIPFVVRMLVAMSERLNSMLGLDRGVPTADEPPPENRVEEVLLRLRYRGTRINLRAAADVRNLFWVPVAWWLMMVLVRFVWWVLWALLTAPAAIADVAADVAATEMVGGSAALGAGNAG